MRLDCVPFTLSELGASDTLWGQETNLCASEKEQMHSLAASLGMGSGVCGKAERGVRQPVWLSNWLLGPLLESRAPPHTGDTEQKHPEPGIA